MLRFIVVMIIVSINSLSIKESYGKEYDFSYINPYKDEAMSYLKEGEISNVEKSINNYYFDCKELSDSEKDKYEKCKDEQSKIKKDAEHNKEQNYKSYELKKKGEEWVAQGGTTGEEMSKSEKNAAEAFSYVQSNAGTNLAENSYTEINKDLSVISNEVTKNPMVRLNAKVKTVEGEEIEGTDCAVSDRNAEKDEIALEEYEKEEEETEIEDSEGSCEKDVEGPFYCEESLEEVGCQYKVPCDFNKSGEGGLFEGCGSGNMAYATNGQPWSYRDGILSFGTESAWTYGHPNHGSESCLSTTFEAKFCIKDRNQVEEFEIVQIHENNVLDIYFNGRLIRDGEAEARRAEGSDYCWYKAGHTAWDSYYYNLKPYLVEGQNTIKIHLRYTMGGHSGVKIRAKAYCCKKWGDGEWKGNCPK